jgi:hypothetical protein
MRGVVAVAWRDGGGWCGVRALCVVWRGLAVAGGVACVRCVWHVVAWRACVGAVQEATYLNTRTCVACVHTCARVNTWEAEWNLGGVMAPSLSAFFLLCVIVARTTHSRLMSMPVGPGLKPVYSGMVDCARKSLRVRARAIVCAPVQISCILSTALVSFSSSCV